MPSHLSVLAPTRLPEFDLDGSLGEQDDAASDASPCWSPAHLHLTAPTDQDCRWPSTSAGTLIPVVLASAPPPVDDDWESSPIDGVAHGGAPDRELAAQSVTAATTGNACPESGIGSTLALTRTTANAIDLTIEPQCVRARLDSDLAALPEPPWPSVHGRADDHADLEPERFPRRRPRLTAIALGLSTALGLAFLLVRSTVARHPAPELDGSLVPGQLRDSLAGVSRPQAGLSDTSTHGQPPPVLPQNGQQPDPVAHAAEVPRAQSTALAQPPAAVPQTRGNIEGTTQVQVLVQPADSRIAIRGRAAKPPYIFEIPQGKRLTLEVAHRGYVTRRVVLDGSQNQVIVAMIPERNAVTESAPSPPADETVPEP